MDRPDLALHRQHPGADDIDRLRGVRDHDRPARGHGRSGRRAVVLAGLLGHHHRGPGGHGGGRQLVGPQRTAPPAPARRRPVPAGTGAVHRRAERGRVHRRTVPAGPGGRHRLGGAVRADRPPDPRWRPSQDVRAVHHGLVAALGRRTAAGGHTVESDHLEDGVRSDPGRIRDRAGRAAAQLPHGSRPRRRPRTRSAARQDGSDPRPPGAARRGRRGHPAGAALRGAAAGGLGACGRAPRDGCAAAGRGGDPAPRERCGCEVPRSAWWPFEPCSGRLSRGRMCT